MTILVAHASRHNSTADIAGRVAEVLATRLNLSATGVDLRPASDVDGLDAYSAVILGSAVYMGRWLESVRSLVTSHTDALTRRPVWLFSVGLAPQRPGVTLDDAATASQTIGAIDHRYFAGRMDRQRLSLAERAVIATIGTPDGDRRDWPAIDAWTAGIADQLLADQVLAGPAVGTTLGFTSDGS